MDTSKMGVNEIKSIYREINIHKRLDHPNIVKLHSSGEENGKIWIVMDFMDKGSLFEFIHKNSKKISENDICSIFVQILEAIAYLHSNHVIHRDIKPENILCDSKGNFKLCDFGFAAPIARGLRRKTFCGTDEYFPPEMFENENQDEKVDIWCMGIMLYEMITQHVPFKDMKLLRRKTVSNFAVINNDVTDDLKKIVKMCLKKNADKRPSAMDLLEHPFLKGFRKNLNNYHKESEEEEEEHIDVSPKHFKKHHFSLKKTGELTEYEIQQLDKLKHAQKHRHEEDERELDLAQFLKKKKLEIEKNKEIAQKIQKEIENNEEDDQYLQKVVQQHKGSNNLKMNGINGNHNKKNQEFLYESILDKYKKANPQQEKFETKKEDNNNNYLFPSQNLVKNGFPKIFEKNKNNGVKKMQEDFSNKIYFAKAKNNFLNNSTTYVNSDNLFKKYNSDSNKFDNLRTTDLSDLKNHNIRTTNLSDLKNNNIRTTDLSDLKNNNIRTTDLSDLKNNNIRTTNYADLKNNNIRTTNYADFKNYTINHNDGKITYLQTPEKPNFNYHYQQKYTPEIKVQNTQKFPDSSNTTFTDVIYEKIGNVNSNRHNNFTPNITYKNQTNNNYQRTEINDRYVSQNNLSYSTPFLPLNKNYLLDRLNESQNLNINNSSINSVYTPKKTTYTYIKNGSQNKRLLTPPTIKRVSLVDYKNAKEKLALNIFKRVGQNDHGNFNDYDFNSNKNNYNGFEQKNNLVQSSLNFGRLI